MISNNMIMRFGRTDTGTPTISEYFGSNQWINFGNDNLFPQELIRIYQNASTMHSSLINRKVDMVAGNGFDTDTPFIRNEYSNDSLNVIAKKVAYDKIIFGGFYLNVIWSKDGNTISQIEHLPYEKMRVAKCDEEKDEIPGYYMSRDWARKNRRENKPVFMAELDKDLAKEYPSQVMFFRTYSPGLDYYTLPYYNSTLNFLKLDYEISTYHLKNVQNGLMPGMIIVNKSGIPTAEERAQIYDETKASLAGADNAGDFIMVYSETPEKAPDFIPVQLNSSDQRFKDLMNQINSTVMRAHSFTSAIAGIETSGKLGTSTEIVEQLQYMQSTVIAPIQKDIEDAFMSIARMNGDEEILNLNEYTIFQPGTVVDASGVINDSNTTPVNNNLTGLSAADNADMYRIVRDFLKGRINEYLAITRLTAYGIDEDRAKKILGLEEE